MGFERVGGEEVWRGRLFSVSVDRFRHDDGEESTREIAHHPGAVAVVAHDGERLYMVAQPREAVGEPALVELVAGKVDPGEDPLVTAKRELAEEIGKAAGSWEELGEYWVSPGFTDQRMHVFLATGLRDASPEAEVEENERIELREIPLTELDEAIARCRDAKSLIGLHELRRRLESS